MKLKEGDIVIEDDGIVTLVYKIIKVDNKKAIGESEFEGKKYRTFYKPRYFRRDHIRSFSKQKGVKDMTIRRLADEV